MPPDPSISYVLDAGPNMPMLLERESETREIERVVAAAMAGSGELLLIEGPPGIGKTSLLEGLRDAALAGGLRPLSARCAELEGDFAFGVVRQLLEPDVQSEGRLLRGGRQALAAPVFSGAAAGDGGNPLEDRSMGILQGLYWLIAALAAQRPLALLIDDAHWSDTASLGFFGYLGRRLEGLPVVLALVTRSGPAGEPVRRACAVAPAVSILDPAPLSVAAVAEIVHALAPGADDAVCRACHDAAGGNAFYVTALARAVAATRDGGGELTAEQLRTFSPAGVTRALTTRLAALPEPARALAHAVALLGDGVPGRIAAKLGGLDQDVGPIADVLRSAGVLAAERTPRFVHPIVRAAVLGDIPAGAAADGHARAARILAADNASLERVAAHLMLCEPTGDAWVYETLVSASRDALARGAPAAAVANLRRALAEPPPDRRARAQLLVALGSAEGLAADPAAQQHLLEAYELVGSVEERVMVALSLAWVRTHQGDVVGGLDLLLQVREELPAGTPPRMRLDADIVNLARNQTAARERTASIDQALRAAHSSAAATDASVLATIAAELTMAGESGELANELARRAVAAAPEQARPVRNHTLAIAIRCLTVGDDLEVAGEMLDSALAQAQADGAALDFAMFSAFRADVRLRAGSVFEAEADAQAALSVCSEYAWPLGLPASAAHLAMALLEREGPERAEQALAQAGLAGPADGEPDVYTFFYLQFVRGRVRRIAGNPARALEDLLESGRRLAAHRETNPALVAWRSEAALAYSSLGEHGAARALADEELELARRFGAPRAIGIALRAAGLVAVPSASEALLREAVEVLSESQARLEHARAMSDLGETLRTRGDRPAAQTLLLAALDLADRCGSTTLSTETLARLRATGARPRRRAQSGPASLTPAQLRVAMMAGEGMSNRAIAEALFVTLKTVEFHLVGAYAKLGVGSRQELAAALATVVP